MAAVAGAAVARRVGSGVRGKPGWRDKHGRLARYIGEIRGGWPSISKNEHFE